MAKKKQDAENVPRRTFKYRLYACKQDKHLRQGIDVAGNMRNHIIALHRRYYRIYGKYIPLERMQEHIAKLRMGRVRKDKRVNRVGKPYGKKFLYWQVISAAAAQDMCARVDKGYQRFFENQKLPPDQRKKVSPPQFKKSKKYTSFTLKRDS